MEFVSQYQSKNPDSLGVIDYSIDENKVWNILYQRQVELLPNRACKEHIKGLQLLNLTQNKIPQLPEVNASLQELTGFQVEPVSALISAKAFFSLLADRKFPVATFIRYEKELDYVKEPDIFHELFGHCPMLTEPVFADFVQAYGQMVLAMDERDWPLMQRLFWFTVEFGLIQTNEGLRAYGGGILSSIGETVYAVESDLPLRIIYHPLAAFRTPYRIDRMQPVYFVIADYEMLFQSLQQDLTAVIAKARRLGEFPPLFDVDENNPNIHILAC